MKLVENQQTHARKLRVGKKPLRQKPFCHNLETRRRACLALQTHLIADSCADRLSKTRGDVASARTRGEAARFEHHDFAAFKPGLVKKRRRNARGFAASRRRGQNETPVPRKCAADVGDSLLCGKHETGRRG